MGHNPVIGIRDFSGEIRFDAEKVEAGSFRFLIKAASLDVQDDISDKDRREMERLMHQEVLESSKFPEIRYEGATATVTKVSDMLYSATLSGDLSLHGVTRSQPLSARVTLFGSMLRASGDFTLSQTDYNIRLVSVAGGALKLKDELKFSFEVVARRE
jgi:polyisoprenoid-binding protein YceI